MGFKFYQLGVLNNFPQQLNIDIDNITILEFINYLLEHYNLNLSKEIFLEDNVMKQGYVFILNGRNICVQDGLSTIIPTGGVLILTPEIFGG